MSRRPLLFAVMTALLLTSIAAPAASELSGPMSTPNIAGSWNLEVVTTAQARIAVVGKVTTTTRSLVAVDIVQNGTALEFHSRVCSIAVESSTPTIKTIIPEAFVNNLPMTRRAGVLRESPRGWELHLPRHWEAQGVKLRDLNRESLPQTPDDPRVFDQDGDGNPGLTVRVEGLVSGEVYTIQRAWDEHRGRIIGTDLIEGTVVWGAEQVILGATSRFLRSAPESSPHPDASKSYFRMRRAEGAAHCGQLKQAV